MSRAETTAMLSKLVEKRLKNRVSYWASEVNFDLGTPRNRRIDYIGFKPFTPGYVLEPSSVELGTFSCYEIKSCMADFKSGHGLTFYGDENYLVMRMNCAWATRFRETSTKCWCPRPKGTSSDACTTCPMETSGIATGGVRRVRCCTP